MLKETEEARDERKRWFIDGIGEGIGRGVVALLAEKALGAPRPYNYPMFGEDAFRTATGVHAAAVVKALRKGDVWLSDRVYSGVPASWIGTRARPGHWRTILRSAG